MARSNRDIYWKGILEDLFPDFLRFFYPNADELFDIDRGFEFLDQEVEKLFPLGDPEHPQSVDKLVKVYTRQGTEEWILIPIEVQGYKGKKEFAERMFTYFYRIRDSYGKKVRSIAIFTDSNKQFHPREYLYQEGETSVVFKFRTYKVFEQDPEVLKESDNPFSVVILTIQLALRQGKLQKKEDYFDLALDLVKRLYQKGFDRKKIEYLLDFIKAYVNFDKPEINRRFDHEVDKLNDKTKTMGIREQILQITKDEATNEKNIVFVTNLIEQTDFSDEKIAGLSQVSIEFVQQIRKQLKSK